MPAVYHDRNQETYLTTTVFVKYNYAELPDRRNELQSISVLCLPNGMLQDNYNPDANTGFWMAGRNAPSRGEDFRVRISLPRLKALANWRVQRIGVKPDIAFSWEN